MPDYPTSTKNVAAIYEARSSHWQEWHAAQSIVEDAIRGRLPDDYNRLFVEGDVRLQVRAIRNADIGLTRLTNKVFPIKVPPLGKRDSDTATKNADRVEKVAYGWYNGSALRGGPEIDGIMYQLARHQVRFADGCLVAFPDHKRKLIFFYVVDPRLHFPPVGFSPWGQTRLDNTLIVTEMTLGEVKQRYALNYRTDKRDATVYAQLNEVFNKSHFGPGGDYVLDDSQKIKVGQFYSRDSWYFCAMGHDKTVHLVESNYGDRNHPGVCPVTSFMQFADEPMFMGQVGIEAALMKVLNQEIRGADKMIDAPTFGPRIVGENIKWSGYNVIDTSLGDKTPPVYRSTPNSPMASERMLGTLMQLSQLFNFNPPSLAGTGEANSGKALKELHAGPHSLVQDILWAPFKNGFPRVFDNCMEMERNLWPNEKKKAQGTKGKTSFEVDYIPAVHLEGYLGRIKIEQGFGLGGYQQTLDGMQRVQMGGMSMQTFMEMTPDISDVAGETRKIESEQLAKLMDAVLESKGPALSVAGIAAIKERIDKGMTKFDAIREVSEAGLLEPAAPEGGGAELPPELAAMLGGGGGQAALPAPPSLEEVRGP